MERLPRGGRCSTAHVTGQVGAGNEPPHTPLSSRDPEAGPLPNQRRHKPEVYTGKQGGKGAQRPKDCKGLPSPHLVMASA